MKIPQSFSEKFSILRHYLADPVTIFASDVGDEWLKGRRETGTLIIINSKKGIGNGDNRYICKRFNLHSM